MKFTGSGTRTGTGGAEVAAGDGYIRRLVGAADGILHAEHCGQMAHKSNVGACKSLTSASHLGGEPVGQQPRVQFEPAQVVFENLGATALVRQPHPHDLVEAAWPAQGRVDVFGRLVVASTKIWPRSSMEHKWNKH
jgi:hypothetical protein